MVFARCPGGLPCSISEVFCGFARLPRTPIRAKRRCTFRVPPSLRARSDDGTKPSVVAYGLARPRNALAMPKNIARRERESPGGPGIVL